ncbi:hypothetical protein DBY21_10155 [Candidatus Gastranaerophilales bacterium]|nr:MAG: hypothetical protein DBY21_10155 [Candidatus Gastranaerophilales bacterium]
MRNRLTKLFTYLFIIVLSLTTTGCSAISSSNISQADILKQDVEFKSIKKLGEKDVSSKFISVKNTLSQMDNATTDLEEYLTGNHTQAEKDNLYAIYLNNMYLYNDVLKSNLELDTSESYPRQERLSFKANGLQFAYDNMQLYLDEYSFNHSLINMKYLGEGAFGMDLDMYYQALKFSKYLSNSWKYYLSIKSRENLYLKDVAFSMYGPGDYTTVNMYELGKWIKDWSNFFVKYPDFYMNDRIQKDLNLYVRYYMNPLQNECDEATPLTKDKQVEWKELLNTFNNSSNAYKILDEGYNILKTNQFKTNDIFMKFYNGFNI